MNESHSIRLVFSRAVKRKPDDSAVRVRPDQLVIAFGHEIACQLSGEEIDLGQIARSVQRARKEALETLKREKRELLKLIASGHADSRRELPKVNQLIAKVVKGQFNAYPLTLVNVGELRAALSGIDPVGVVSTEPDSDPEVPF